MQHGALDEAMAMEGVADAGRRSGEIEARPFRDVDTGHHLPHLAHAKDSVSLEDRADEPSTEETFFQLHPSRDIDESFDHPHSQTTPGGRPRISLIDGTFFFCSRSNVFDHWLAGRTSHLSRRAAGFFHHLEL